MRSDRQALTFREMAKDTGTTIRSSFKIWTEKKILIAAGICRINPTNYYGKKERRTRMNICTDILQQAEAFALPYVKIRVMRLVSLGAVPKRTTARTSQYTHCLIYVKLKDRKRSLTGKNDHNAL